jgi:hypothetical protein
MSNATTEDGRFQERRRRGEDLMRQWAVEDLGLADVIPLRPRRQK